MAIQWVAEVSGYSSGRCVSKAGMLSEWDAGPDEGEIGSDGVRIGRARCLEACLGVTAGVMAEAKRCYSCESLHMRPRILLQRTKTIKERKFIILGRDFGER